MPGETEEAQSQPAVTCPRHGPVDRPLPCTRCGRPSCPQCLTPAPVGSHCPDCIRDAARTQRVARPPWAAGRGSTARVTTVLVVINVLVYLLEASGTKIGGQTIETRYEMSNFAVAHGQWWRLMTGAFLHASVLHVVFNMAALAALGSQVEVAVGRTRFLGLYLVAALGGSAASYVLGPTNELAVGASGAVFGIFAAYFVIARRVGADTGPIVVLLVLNLLFSFSGAIDWRAHVGGMVTGGVVTWAMSAVPRRLRQRAAVQIAVVLVVALALIGAIAYRTATFPAV